MKVILEDDDGQDVEVGYGVFEVPEKHTFADFFWIETNKETVTLPLNKNNLSKLIAALQFLKENV